MNAQTTHTFDQRARAALEFSGRQLRHLITQHLGYFPLYTVKGKWKHDSEAWTNWCEGFLGGMLWILYRNIKDAWWQERAEHYAQLIEHRKTDCEVHDLGFLFLPTWKAPIVAIVRRPKVDPVRCIEHLFQQTGGRGSTPIPGSHAKNWLTAARSVGFRTPRCSWRSCSRRD